MVEYALKLMENPGVNVSQDMEMISVKHVGILLKVPLL